MVSSRHNENVAAHLAIRFLDVAVAEWNNINSSENMTEEEKAGGRAALRGMAVRLNLYDLFVQATDNQEPEEPSAFSKFVEWFGKPVVNITGDRDDDN